MSYKNTGLRHIAQISLLAIIFQVCSPIISISHAVNVQYYVDATNGNDANPGTSSGAPWQTLSRVNAEVLQPDDHVSFLCGESWTGEVLDIQESGNVGVPIVFDSYSSGSCSAKPILGGVTTGNMSDAEIDGLSLIATGSSTVTIGPASVNISLKNSDITHGSGNGCIEAINSTGLSMSGNTFVGCSYAFSGSEVEGVISHNTFSGMTDDAVQIVSTQAVTINNNIFSNLEKGAVVFGVITSVTQNDISNVCQGSGTGCAAIRNESYSPLGTSYNADVSQNIIQNVGNGISMNNYGISIANIDVSNILQNTVNNAEEALHIEDAKNLNIMGNIFALSRARGVHVIQNSSGAVSSNTFQENSILEKNPDYPYIEVRDNVAGGPLTNMLSPTDNKFFPLYKPNTSYIRAVKYGGETQEYDRKELLSFDPTMSRFDLFGYKSYTNTGSSGAADRLLGVGLFESGISGWTITGTTTSPSLSHNALGSFSGGSMQVMLTGGSAESIFLTNNTNFSMIGGSTYRVTGYLKSGSGNINVKMSLHKAGDRSTLYGDRISETYASASGRTFVAYFTVASSPADARITFETSNPDVGYEIDEVQVSRITPQPPVKNNTANEVHIVSNTGSTTLGMGCPGGDCSEYIDITSVPTSIPAVVSWSGSFVIAPYTSAIVVDSVSPNIMNPPTGIFRSLDNGGVDAGSHVTIDWNIQDSLSQTVIYDTAYSGMVTSVVGSTGVINYIPRFILTGSESYPFPAYHALTAENEYGTFSMNPSGDFQIIDAPPTVSESLIIGVEDGGIIYGTLTGSDIVPGDFSGFILGPTSPPGIHTRGTFDASNIFSGSVSFTPNPDFCGTTAYFRFQGFDQRGVSGGGTSSEQDQHITVTCMNDTPIVYPENFASYGGIPKNLILTGGTHFDDPDNQFETQTYTLNYANLSTGSLSTDDAGMRFIYTAPVGYVGTATFDYSITDQSGATSNTGTLNVDVTTLNYPPIATSSGYTINEDITLSDTLTGSDANGDTLSYTAANMPLHGALTIMSNGSFNYTPTSNYYGSDSFVFRIDDGIATATGLISLTIDPVADAPVAVADSISPTEDTPTLIPVMANDSDPDGGTLTLTGYVSLTPNAGVVVDMGTGFLYTPATGYVGSDSFTYRLVDDTGLLSNIVTVSINVTPLNSAPTSLDMSLTTSEDNTLSGVLSATDPDLDTLTYILDTDVSNGVLTLSATGSFRYVPTANYSGLDSFTYHVSDGVLTSTASTVSISVNPVNDAPTAVAASYTVLGNVLGNAGHVFTGSVTGSDIEGSLLSFSSSIDPIHGVFSLAPTGAFSYTPALGYTGSDSFIFFVSDGVTQSTGAVALLNVQTVINTPPVAMPANLTVVGNTATNSGHILIANLMGTDTEGAVLSFTAVTIPLYGTLSLSSTGRLTYIPNLGFSGSDSFVFAVHDGGVQSAGATVNISVTNNVIVIPPPAPPAPSAGPGGGGGGGSAVPNPVVTATKTIDTVKSTNPKSETPKKPTETEIELDSAPENKPVQFVMFDPTGLLSQLLLTNRVLGVTGGLMPAELPLEKSEAISIVEETFEYIFSNFFQGLDDSSLLRSTLHVFVLSADEASDTVAVYDHAIDTVGAWEFERRSTLERTQKYVLRILERNRKHYEELVYRNALARFEEDLESASEEIQNTEGF